MISGHRNEKLFSMGIEILGLALIFLKAARVQSRYWVFLGVAETKTIVGSKKLSCCSAGIVHCLLNLLYYAVWSLHSSATPSCQKTAQLNIKRLATLGKISIKWSVRVC